MTSDEASFYLANMDRKYMEEGMSEALNMAIKVLEQEPCEDAISREATINAIYDLCGENVSLKENPFRDNPHMDAVIDELENLPSVSPQQKMGRWIETQEPNDVEPFKLWECSRCEQRQRRKSNYCPNCGAKMVEPQESEEQMTREEAIKGLTSLVEVRRKYCDMQTMKDEIQCLEMAIQALKQEQTRDEKMIDAIDFAIKATNSQDDYSMGMRNGMRYVKSLINGKEPQYELRQTDEEIKLGIDIGDEVVNEWGAKGVVIGIDTSYEGEVLLSLLMRNHKVPQLVVASSYKTKTGRHFPQIIEVLEQIKGESDGK